MSRARRKAVILGLCLLNFFAACNSSAPFDLNRSSALVTQAPGVLGRAQAYFEEHTGHRFEVPFDSYVSIHLLDSQQDTNEQCQASEDVAGCIQGYWHFYIYAHPDPQVRCQAILHEAGHMALAQISEGQDWDHDHSHPYFHEFVFNPDNCHDFGVSDDAQAGL